MLELGDEAARWAEKIKNPPSLLDKLGVKPGQRVSVVGIEDRRFLDDLAARVDDLTRGRAKAGSDLVLVAMSDRADLPRLAKLREAIKATGAIWVVWPKGRKELREDDVREFGKTRRPRGREGGALLGDAQRPQDDDPARAALSARQEEAQFMPQRIGFAGLGLMGSRMARQFLDKGFPLAVWNRSPEKAKSLVDRGAKLAATPRALAEISDVVISCVADPNAVGRLVFAEDGIRPVARPGLSLHRDLHHLARGS